LSWNQNRRPRSSRTRTAASSRASRTRTTRRLRMAARAGRNGRGRNRGRTKSEGLPRAKVVTTSCGSCCFRWCEAVAAAFFSLSCWNSYLERVAFFVRLRCGPSERHRRNRSNLSRTVFFRKHPLFHRPEPFAPKSVLLKFDCARGRVLSKHLLQASAPGRGYVTAGDAEQTNAQTRRAHGQVHCFRAAGRFTFSIIFMPQQVRSEAATVLINSLLWSSHGVISSARLEFVTGGDHRLTCLSVRGKTKKISIGWFSGGRAIAVRCQEKLDARAVGSKFVMCLLRWSSALPAPTRNVRAALRFDPVCFSQAREKKSSSICWKISPVADYQISHWLMCEEQHIGHWYSLLPSSECVGQSWRRLSGSALSIRQWRYLINMFSVFALLCTGVRADAHSAFIEISWKD